MDFEKYDIGVIKNLNKDNVERIIIFLENNSCDYIEDLLEDYLDIFTFEYDDFEKKFNRLNQKYNNELIERVRDDMNILEEFYIV